DRAGDGRPPPRRPRARQRRRYGGRGAIRGGTGVTSPAAARAQLAERYEARLRDFLLHGQEDALAASYALGREAIEIGLGVLDLCAIHEAAVRSVDATSGVPEQVGGARAFAFLSEGLAPFEMVHRGFQE